MTAPASWKRQTLGELGRYFNGRGFKKQEWRSAGRPIIRIQNLTGSSEHFNYFEGEADDRHVVHPGDLLVSWAATLGAYIWNGPEAVLNQHIFKVESYIDPKFHKYLLDHKLEELMRHTHGSGMVHITRGRFDAVPVDVPPIEEQRCIVDLLEDHLSRLDAAETLVRDGLRRMAALRTAHLQEAFDEGAAELHPLLDVASIANGQTPKGLVEILSPEPGDESVPFFKVGDMNAADGRWMNDARFFVSCESAEQLGIHVRPAGTVLIPKRGGAIATNKKRILRSPAAYDLNTMGLVPNDSLDSAYLWHWLQTVDLGRIADGSNVPQINATQIRELNLPVPDLQAQVAIANRLDKIDESLTRLAQQVESVRRRGGGLRRALLSAAFSGRLTSDVAADSPQIEEMVGA